jgi:hypothetical protein
VAAPVGGKVIPHESTVTFLGGGRGKKECEKNAQDGKRTGQFHFTPGRE